ncbi:unnamed protein product [Closterium sp. Yama58-4]|nr:unnamed protein product [Closterium sp. Yama58-4]
MAYRHHALKSPIAFSSFLPHPSHSIPRRSFTHCFPNTSRSHHGPSTPCASAFLAPLLSHSPPSLPSPPLPTTPAGRIMAHRHHAQAPFSHLFSRIPRPPSPPLPSQQHQPVASWPIDTMLKRLSRTTGIDISLHVDATSLSSALSHSPPPNAGHRWDLRKHLPHVLPPLPEVLPPLGGGSNSAASGAAVGTAAAGGAAAGAAAAAGAGGGGGAAAAGGASVGSENKREEEKGGDAEAMREELRWREILRDSSDLRGRSSKHLAALRKYLGDVVVASYRAHLALFVASPQQMEFFERESLLSTLDRLWSVHIANMARLRNAVSVQGFGRENPLEEFKIEGTRFFISTLFAMRRESVQALLSAFLADVEGGINGGAGDV